MAYIKYNDPSHGWLRVKTKELHDLGIEGMISGYSYISDNGKYVYLEEDKDMSTFLNAKCGIDKSGFTYSSKHSDSPSNIRRKNPYTPPLPFAP